MTITFVSLVADGEGREPIEVFEGGVLFHPAPIAELATRLAAEGRDVVCVLSLAELDASHLTGVSRSLVAVGAESRLRDVLRAAGFGHVTRCDCGAGAIALRASTENRSVR